MGGDGCAPPYNGNGGETAGGGRPRPTERHTPRRRLCSYPSLTTTAVCR